MEKSASATLDTKLARQALEKMRAGRKPTAPERAALRRVEVERDRELRWRHYRAVPLGEYVELSGRAHKVLRDVARRYGISCTGKTVDLQEALQGLHDFIAKYGPRIAISAAAQTYEEARRRRTTAQAETLELDLAIKRGQYVLKTDVDRGRLQLIRWLVGVLDVAAAELAPMLPGRSAMEIKGIVQNYFDERRRAAVERSGVAARETNEHANNEEAWHPGDLL